MFLYSCDDDNNPNTDTFKDKRDGQVYKTVKIGEQTWMAENLKYLPSVVDPQIGSETTPYYYVNEYYGTNVTEAKVTLNYKTYGVLYNWPAAMNGATSSSTNPSSVQGVCPKGWHLPSAAEYTSLINYLGGESVAGGKLKEAGTTHWNSPNTGSTNITGFTALPGGCRSVSSFSGIGTFSSPGSECLFWCATEYNFSEAFSLYLNELDNGVSQFEQGKYEGHSVRCVKD